MTLFRRGFVSGLGDRGDQRRNLRGVHDLGPTSCQIDLDGAGSARYGDAAEILDGLVLAQEFAPFLTIPAYAYLD